ncbi:MAG: glycerol-3-phosphate acyltransferase, partial [Olegusella sp.]|nr:glycerol-3-phosphate acyltransferase [Olegusella sp.]
FAHKTVFDLGVGNPGMANVGHELGHKAAACVLAGDIAKTLAAWLIARALFPAAADVAGLWAGLGSTLGHNYPVWHRFRGGKGVTTTCSAIILAAPVIGVVSCLLGFATVVVSGYLCWGAIAITAFYLVLVAIFKGGAERIAIAAALLVLMAIAHGSAVAGIKTGKTPRASLADKVLAKLGRKQAV